MLKRTVKRLFGAPLESLRRYGASLELGRIERHGHESVRATGRALSSTVNCNVCRKGGEFIRLIESRRTRLLQSEEEIDSVDFGAGDPLSRRTREEMSRGVRTTRSVATVCRASKPAFWCTLLYKLLRELKPVSCVELGTCVGISAAYQSAALGVNGDGTMKTLEGCPEISRLARETLDELGLCNTEVITGPFHETLKSVLEESKPVDYFFNDGHHDRDAVLEYFNTSLPYLSGNAVMVFDDISWSPGMRQAWSEIESDERVAATLDLKEIGIAFLGTEGQWRKNLSLRLDSLIRTWSPEQLLT